MKRSPRYAVVAETVERACHVRDAFDLRWSDWACLSVDQEIGARYDRVVVCLGLARASSAAPRLRAWLTPGNEDRLAFL